MYKIFPWHTTLLRTFLTTNSTVDSLVDSLVLNRTTSSWPPSTTDEVLLVSRKHFGNSVLYYGSQKFLDLEYITPLSCISGLEPYVIFHTSDKPKMEFLLLVSQNLFPYCTSININLIGPMSYPSFTFSSFWFPSLWSPMTSSLFTFSYHRTWFQYTSPIPLFLSKPFYIRDVNSL